MILVICDEADASALWAADSLEWRGLAPTLLTGADLASALSWRHAIAPDGRAETELRLSDGRIVRSGEVRAALNRLPFLPRAWTARIGGPDRDYAMQEMQAFYLSWLHSLPGRVVNPPTPQGLCGNMRHPSAWIALAARAGLPVRPWTQGCGDDPAAAWQAPREPACLTVIAAGAAVIGPDAIVGPHGAACLRLAEASGCPLLGVDFAPGEDGMRVVGASVTPDLARGGDALADAIVKALVP